MNVSGDGRYVINLVPYTGEGEVFEIKLLVKILAKMHDHHGTICYSKVFDWLLLKFSGATSFYKLIATKMWNDQGA